MDREEIEQAKAQAEDAVTRAIQEGRRPALADLLLLQHWQREKTLRDRLRGSAFPLVVVASATLVMALMATHRPPVTEVQGHLQTTAVELQISDANHSGSLMLDGANGVMTFGAFGFAAAQLGSCQFDVRGQGVDFRGSSLQVGLSGVERLRLEVTRHSAPVAGQHATVSLLAEIKTDAVVDATGVSGANTTSGAGALACPGYDFLELDPKGDAEIELTAQVAAVAFPEFLKVSPLSVSRTTFGRRDGDRLLETCALRAARLELSQEIRVIGASAIKYIELPKGTCLDLTDGDVRITPGTEGIIGVRFRSSGGDGANIDDGLPADAVTLTYLEILIADPSLALILGAIAFILTTVLSAAAALKEIVS